MDIDLIDAEQERLESHEEEDAVMHDFEEMSISAAQNDPLDPQCPSANQDLLLVRAAMAKLPESLINRPAQYYCGLCNLPQTLNKTLLQCTVCQVMHYCSEEHRQEHSAAHEDMCENLRSGREELIRDEEDMLYLMRHGSLDYELDEDDDPISDEWALFGDFACYLEDHGDSETATSYFGSCFRYLMALLEMGTKTSVTLALQLAVSFQWSVHRPRYDCWGMPAVIAVTYLMLDELQEFHNYQHWYHRRITWTVHVPEEMAPVDIFESPLAEHGRSWLSFSLLARRVFLARIYLILHDAEVIYTTGSVLPRKIRNHIANFYLRDLGLHFSENGFLSLNWVQEKMNTVFKDLQLVQQALNEVNCEEPNQLNCEELKEMDGGSICAVFEPLMNILSERQHGRVLRLIELARETLYLCE